MPKLFLCNKKMDDEIKRKNRLPKKKNSKMEISDRTKAATMKPISSPMGKSAPKPRPTLPVCLTLPPYQKFMKNTECNNSNTMPKLIKIESLQCSVKKRSVLDTFNGIPQENKESSKTIKKAKMECENSSQTNNAKVINKNKITDNLNKASDFVIKPPRVIKFNFDKITPVEIKEVSVQVPENDSYEYQKDINSGHLDVTTKLQNKQIQTEEVTVIYGEDIEILRAVKRFNFTLSDMERFYELSLENNNNDIEFENQNDTIDLRDEESESITNEQSLLENNGYKLVDKNVNVNKITVQKNSASDVNAQIVKRNYHSSSLATGLLDRLKLWSDLNKMILRTFYEGILIVKDKSDDKVTMENYLTRLSQNLVDQICEMVTTFSDAHGRQTGRVVEIIELDDSEDFDILPGKIPSQTDSCTTEPTTGTKKKKSDAEQYQNHVLQNDDVEIHMTGEIQDDERTPERMTQNYKTTNPKTLEPNNPLQKKLDLMASYQCQSHINPNPETQTRTQMVRSSFETENPEQLSQTLQNVVEPVNEGRRIQNQKQNISSIYRRAINTEADSQRTHLRKFRVNSMANFPENRSNNHDFRIYNPYNAYRSDLLNDNRYYGTYKNQQGLYLQNFHQNMQTPNNTNYQNNNRTFHNVIQPNPQHNTPANFQNMYPYNYGNSYSSDYRNW